MATKRIYLDNAATTWPKPPAVYEAVEAYQRNLGCSPGRSTYRDAMEADRVVAEARRAVARCLGLSDPHRIVFGFNGTDVLNMAIRGVVRPGDHVITTAADHNSVLRPLRFYEEYHHVQVDRIPCDSRGFVILEELEKALRPETRLVAVNHASNVVGTLQPLEEIVKLVRRHCEAIVLVDAAQSLGHLPLFPKELGIDLLAAPGHKGLLGPMGTGVLYLAPRMEERLVPLRMGGTGSRSDEDRQPDFLPDKFEPGNHNAPGLAGLVEGIRYLEARTLEEIRQHEIALTGQLIAGLKEVPGVTLYGPPSAEQRVGVVSLNIEGYSPEEVAGILDLHYGIQVRSGIHCAPLMHRTLGTVERGGAVRFSFSPFTTREEIEAAIQAVTEIARHR
jgi:cysteine desulfurase family protein